MQKTALLFAGQGAQIVGMAKNLSREFQTARSLVERANATLGYDLASICFDGPESELTKTEHAQPGIFLVSWIAFQLLKERVPGLLYNAAAGLSLGEFTALAAASVMTFEDGLRIVRQRGRFMQESCELARGSMAAIVGLEESLTREVCDETGVEIANLNCPGQIVISGEEERIEQACDRARQRGARRALPLNVAGAYHSKLMRGAQTKLKTALTAMSLHAPSIPVISNVTARPHGTPAEIHARLVEQVTSPVRWEESIRYLLSEGVTRFIELGPGTVLSGFLKRIDKNAQMLNVADVSSLEATASALRT